MEWNSKRVKVVAILAVAITIILAVVVWNYTRGPPPEKTWINGDYIVGDINIAIIHAEDNRVTFQQLKFLDSESYANQYMRWIGGDTNDTVVITFNGETATANISSDKKVITGGPSWLVDNLDHT